jgi:hypothetical protein
MAVWSFTTESTALSASTHIDAVSNPWGCRETRFSIFITEEGSSRGGKHLHDELSAPLVDRAAARTCRNWPNTAGMRPLPDAGNVTAGWLIGPLAPFQGEFLRLSPRRALLVNGPTGVDRPMVAPLMDERATFAGPRGEPYNPTLLSVYTVGATA